MPKATVLQPLRRYAVLALLLPILLANPCLARTQSAASAPQQPTQKKQTKPIAKNAPATPGAEATLEAKQQRQVGQIYYADGDVDVRYQNTRLRADHVEYNEDTRVVIARGHVQLDYLTQHLEATDARYELGTGRGTFHNVRATFAVQRRPRRLSVQSTPWSVNPRRLSSSVPIQFISKRRKQSASMKTPTSSTAHG